MYQRIVFLIFLFNVFYSKAQIIEWSQQEVPSFIISELKNKGYLNDNGKFLNNDGKALLIFKTDEELIFDSSFENIKQPSSYTSNQLEDGVKLYVLPLKAQPQKVIIKSDSDENKISFQQPFEKETLPGLKPNELYYFEITSKLALEYYNSTESEKAKGNMSQPVGPNVSDALIIIKSFPKDLKIAITAENGVITKLSEKDNQYSVFLNTRSAALSDFVLNIHSDELGNTPMRIFDIKSKEQRFYVVKKPQAQTLLVEDQLINSDKYKFLEGYWSGQFMHDQMYIHITEINAKFNQVKGEITKDGLNYSFKGSLVSTGEKDDYLLNIKTTENNLIGSMENFSIDLHIKKGVLNGYIIDVRNNAYDVVLLKSKSPSMVNPASNFEKYLQKYQSVVGSYKLSSNQSLSVVEIIVTQLEPSNKVAGILRFNNNEVCAFTSNLVTSGSGATLNLELSSLCNVNSQSIELTINSNRSPEITLSEPNKGKVRKELSFTSEYSISYAYIMPSQYQYLTNNLEQELERQVAGNSKGELNINYKLKFDKFGQKKFSYNTISKSLNTDEFSNVFARVTLPSPTWDGNRFETEDIVNMNIAWNTNKKTISYSSKDKAFASQLNKHALPYGKYTIANKEISINERTYLQQEIIKYKYSGPLASFNSMLLPGWGTRKVTYNEKKGWGRFAMVMAPFAAAAVSQLISNSNFNNYRNTDILEAPEDAARYLSNANTYRRLSLVSFGLGATAYIFDISWVINKGLQNRNEAKKINSRIKSSESIFIRKDLIKL